MAALDGQALADWVLRPLGLPGSMKHLRVQERALLTEVVAAGTLDSRTVVREAIRAVAGGTPAVRAVVEDLRAHLASMLP